MRYSSLWPVVVVFCAFLALGAGAATAQAPENVEERLPAPEPAARDKEPAYLDRLRPGPPVPAVEDDEQLDRFVLTAVAITGANAIPPERFAPLYDDLLAQYVTIDDVAALADAITGLYREKGYFLSRAIVPAQNPASGVLKIEIAEGYIADVEFEDGAPAAVRKRLIDVMKERPLRLSTLERKLALIGDLPGMTVASSKIEPQLDDFARHRLIVKIKQDRIEGSIYADNRGTKDAGPHQAYVSLSANSALTTGDQLTAGLFFIPASPDELALVRIAYATPIGGGGLALNTEAMTSSFKAGGPRAAEEVESRTTRLRVGLSYPLIRRRKLALLASAGLQGRNFEEERMDAVRFEDRIRSVYASMTLRKAHLDGVTSVSAEATRGLNILGASTTGLLSRPDATAEFTKFNAEFGRLQTVSQKISVYASVAGQYALDPLLASEEFSLGGARYGRAYDYSEFKGEDGVAANVELRYGGPAVAEFLKSYQFYGFYDYGAVWNDNVPPQFEKLDLSSAGGGLRLNFSNDLHFNAELAKPLDGAPFTQGDQSWRGFFNLSKSF
ncbi:ShlB/FhaC/HecB family hemolysin secretion/activation protein [Hyphococcus luteus]|uniref:ShlB/FhaC/HecB family hemolysin secretion/activation protein n=1 Tax=Hyphococcus luteus TaxID=2058213 RepID=A0A2S7K0M1_9PROT|nr:ShlB/FhaC/HecB family hemolysin secretion/activation protein [Marinicaulis flavus]PQA86011.1 hypothetical protein CW354_16660 [Marinicaulis flavus]